MKTTIELNDALFAQAKAEAKKRGTTMRAIFEQALRQFCEQPKPKRFVLRELPFNGDGLQPGQSYDWNHLRKMVYPTPGDDEE